MTRQEIETRYKQAELLYIMKEFEDALDILDELLKTVPKNKELLIAKAKCLASMGLREEARKICRQLITDQHDAHAAAMLERLDSDNEFLHVI